MKNFAILGLSSLLLFGVAAGLSVWMQQNKQQAEAAEKEKEAKKEKEKEKSGVKDDKKESKVGDKTDKGKEKEPAKDDDLGTAAALKAQAKALADREARADKRDARADLILQDIRAQQEEVDRLRKQVMEEAKTVAAQVAARDAQAKTDTDNIAKLPKVPFAGGAIPKAPAPAGPDPVERRNIEQTARIYEKMPPDTAGRLIQQHADGGKMDFAAQVLMAMQERSSGKVIAEIPDPAVAAQLLEKMQKAKRPTPGLAAGGS